ncbi:MAG: hypothetical protein NC318_04395 [Blautia sp.]|nr:hypothetical protein [Lachnoclostridium sp.]MCM1210820.1 hypothetical protein [Blautia sp.]
MRVVKRISLFIITAGVMFSAGSYATLKAEQYFYPNKYGQHKESTTGTPKASSTQTVKDNAASRTIEAEDVKTEEESVIEAVMEEAPVISADTVYLVEEVNLSAGTIEEKEEPVPVKYIGLDRTSLIEELNAYDSNPALTDLKLGFETIELASFSKDRVVVCKYYRPEEEEKGFYLMVADHYVIVYEEDKKTLHTNTDILLESLSIELQEEIMQGKYVENEQELYNFLESYSS